MATDDSKTDDGTPKKPSEQVTFWLNEIGAARKREQSWRKEGEEIRKLYEGDKTEETPFNILYSNTETMAPALYSSVPRPVVQRRYKDEDPIGKAAATAATRLLEFTLDTNVDGYETFHEAMKAATHDGLLPGRGFTCVKYDAVTEGDVVSNEMVCPDSRSWDRVFFGFARKWSKVPWVAFEEHLDEEECTRLFGEAVAKKIDYTAGEDEDEDEGKQRSDRDERNQGERKTALVYQIWDKDDRRIKYVSPQYRDAYLKNGDDPLQLTGFYNFPKPMQFIEKSNCLKPVPLYRLYKNQARELNRITKRITRITEALKARGIYDGSLGGDIGKLMDADDNALVPADKTSALAAEKGLQNAIWFWPIEKLITVHEKLMVAREQCKQVIYEIMGISDIIRGASKASETLGAQQIKSQWGTLRIKPKQQEVQRYARDMLRIMLEIAATKFSEDTWAKMTGLPYLTQMQVQQAQALLAAAQQMPMQPGQPPPPAVLQAQKALQQPTWDAVLKMLRDDMQRAYRIDIETNSTVEPEAVEDQKNISDLMTALGQFLNGVGPLVEKGVMPFEVAQTMMLAISRRYRFGTEIEDQIKAMQAPPKQDNGEAAKSAEQQAAAQKSMQAMQANIDRLTMELQKAQAANELQSRKSELDNRETAFNAEKQLFEIEKSAAIDKIKTENEVGLKEIGHAQKVTSLMEQKAKDWQANASRADAKIGQGMQTLKQTTQTVEQARTEMLTAIEAQGQRTEMMVAEILKAIRAPRVRVPVRGPDGRITQVIDGPQEESAEQRPN